MIKSFSYATSLYTKTAAAGLWVAGTKAAPNRAFAQAQAKEVAPTVETSDNSSAGTSRRGQNVDLTA